MNIDSLQISDNLLEAHIINKDVEGPIFKLSLTPISGNIFRIQVDEIEALHHRYKPQYALNGEPQVEK